MTQQKESVVTAERFNTGLTYDEYFSRIQRNREKFEYNFDQTVISPEDADAFRRQASEPGGVTRVLALGEDWCPDVFRGLPVMARIAEAGGLDLRVFPRDENLDIMGEFLNHGEHQSIPTFVFYTSEHRYIAHWIERPARANAEMGEQMKLYEGLDRNKPEDYQKMRELANEFQQGPVWASWRDETVREIRQLLEKAH